MKIYISKPRYHWFSPYTLLEKVFFWREIDYDEPIIKTLNKVLEPFSIGLQKILDIIHPEINYVKIDGWDTWNMDSTLSKIILPMLKQMKESKQGAPFTDDDDVPPELTSLVCPPKKYEWDTDENWFKRWEWILDEIIWTFEQLNTDWEEQFYSGVCDYQWVPTSNNCSTMTTGPNHTQKFDEEGYKIHSARIDNGLRLFGKYYRNLWD